MPPDLAERIPEGASSKTRQAFGSKPKRGGSGEIRLRIGLAARDIVSRDHSAPVQADLPPGVVSSPVVECPRSRWCSVPAEAPPAALSRQAGPAGRRVSFDLALLDAIGLTLAHRDGAPPCGRSQSCAGRGPHEPHSSGSSPCSRAHAAPDTRDARCGVNQHSVQVKQDGLANKRRHDSVSQTTSRAGKS